MPRALVVRRGHFNAAHRLHNPAHSDEWNRNAFGPCNNINGHGHNYEVEMCVEGEIDPDTGYVLDVAILKALFDEYVHKPLDHRHLNFDWEVTERLLAEERIVITPGSGFGPGGAGYVRFSLVAAPETLREACRRAAAPWKV